MVKGYKKTEIGVVPSDWNVLPFGEVFRTLSNNTLSRDQLNYDSGSIKDIHYGDVLILYPEVLDCSRDDIPYVNNDAPLSCQPLQQGDVIISDTAEDETVGKAVEIANQGNTNIVAGLHTIPCRVKNGNFVSGWLGYFINSHYYHDQLLPYIHGTKVSSIARESLADTYIVMPPYGEQEKIVKALTDIGRLISEAEQLIEKYQAMKQGCLQHMFPCKGQTEPDMRLPGFTGAWEQRKVGNICSISAGKSNTQDKVDDGIYPFYVRSPIVEHSNKYLYDEEAVLTVGDGVGTGKVFHYVNGKYDLHQRVYRMFGFSEDVSAKFFYDWFSEHFYKRVMAMTAKTSVDSVRYEMIADMDIQLPSLPEQKAIADFFFSLDNLITLHQRKCEKYKMIKQGMMEDLLTGKVRLK